MSLRRCMPLVVAAYAVAAVFAARAQGSSLGIVVRCESKGGARNACPVDARAQVRLLRQLSDSACDHGRTWGTDDDGIWVAGGCRGEFAVGARQLDRFRGRGQVIGYGGGVQVMRCESNNKQKYDCAATVHSGAVLQRQISGAPCVEGRTWGWTQDSIWVDKGCRGEFAIR